MNLPTKHLAIGFVVALCLVYVWISFQPPRPLSTEVYVWQREESPALLSSLERSQGIASRRHFLAFELGRINGQWRVSRSKLPDERFKGNGLVIRIGSSLSGETWHPGEALDKVLEEIAWAAAKPVTDFQIDYDSPQRSLGNYVRLLQAVKKAHPDKTWSITALPSWLNASDAKQLFTTADGVVMQLHSLKLPDKPEMPVILCDPIAARETVRQMSKLGIPYHIALNTYSCEVWFDANDANRAITRFVYDLPTGNVLERWKPVQNAANTARAQFGYDDRKLFVATDINELGHQRDYFYEYGTGTKLRTDGPNARTCMTVPSGMSTTSAISR